MIHNEILWKLELFALNSPFYKQIFKKSLEIPTKSISLQQQIPPRLSTMRTMVGLRFLYGYMNYDKQPTTSSIQVGQYI
jgi:hypothetical protein